eukprot:1143932_1
MSSETKKQALYLGCMLLPFGFGAVLSSPYYSAMFKEIGEAKDRSSSLFVSFSEIAYGVYILRNHNTFNTVPEALISSIGYVCIIEGALISALPEQYLAFGRGMLRKEEYVKYLGFAVIGIGGYFLKLGLENDTMTNSVQITLVISSIFKYKWRLSIFSFFMICFLVDPFGWSTLKVKLTIH